jgi:hypothetical protein
MKLLDIVVLYGWLGVYLHNVPVIHSSESAQNSLSNAQNSKRLKVFPQEYLPEKTRKDFDFVLWFDNKFDLHQENVYESIYNNWNPLHAMMLHRRVSSCCGADLEFNLAMKQERYFLQREMLITYMNEEVALGYPVHGERDFQTGFIIYNMNHKDTFIIQNDWESHIKRAGINCQISFYFVSQRYLLSIAEFVKDWNHGRVTIHSLDQ